MDKIISLVGITTKKQNKKGYKSQGHQACGNWVMKSILDVQAHVTHDWEIEACRPHLSFWLIPHLSFE
jgi:hypothetical protein